MSANEKKPDGGPAFPRTELVPGGDDPSDPLYPVTHGGMSLRDYFAAHAPEPSIEVVATERGIDRSRNPHNDSYKPPLRSDPEIRAYLRYRHADAMLAEREKK